jgi:hypothetical protein
MFEQGAGALGEDFQGAVKLGLWYDPDKLVVEGVYHDEVSAYRARRRWIEALEHNFLLEEDHDFHIKVRKSRGGKLFRVRCDFVTACGRYAFWRLTHHQAPEVQLIMETAHLAHSPQGVGDSIYGGAMFGDDDEMLLSIEQLERGRSAISRRWDSEPYLFRALRKIQEVAHKVFLLARPTKSN